MVLFQLRSQGLSSSRPSERERETLGEPGHVTAHDKLLPSQGILAQLFYSQESIRDFQVQNARDLAQFHAVCKNRILSTI